MKAVIVAVAAATLLAGCQTSETPEQYLTRCHRVASSFGLSLKADLAMHMRVPKEKVPETFCKRVLAGLQSGRLNNGDILNAAYDKSSRLWKELR